MDYYAVLAVAGTVIISYCFGSVSFGVIFTRIYTGKDVRDMGSGNTGMTNVLRTAGTMPGVLTGVGDFAKGIASMYLGQTLFLLVGLDTYVGSCLAAVCVLLGHLFPVFFQFRGGKGVMTSTAILLMLNPTMLLYVAIIFIGTFIFTRTVSLSALISVTFMPFINFALAYFNETEILFSTIFTAMITILLYITLRDNIKRIIDKTEPKLTIKKSDKSSQKES